MKKLFALLMACLLVCGALPARAGLEIYYYDLTDTEKIYHSSGTGGVMWCGFLEGAGHSRQGEWATEKSPFDAAINDYIRQWTQEAWANWGATGVNVETGKYPPQVSLYQAQDGTELLALRLTQSTRTNDATPGSHIQTQLYDWTNKRVLQLSDLFYDGFDYINYINDCVINAQDYLQDYGSLEMYVLTDGATRQPFAGLPNDYPFFDLITGGSTYLNVLFERSSPFFSSHSGYGQPGEALVPLLHSNSPFGGCRINSIQYETSFPALSITLHSATAVTVDDHQKRSFDIVQKLEVVYEPLVRHLQLQPGSSPIAIEPGLFIDHDRLKMGLIAQTDFWEENYFYNYLYIGIMNADTGAFQGLEGLLEYCLAEPQAACYAVAPLDMEEGFTLLEGYCLPADSRAIYAWQGTHGNDPLCWLLVQTPDGEYVQVQLSYEVYYDYINN